MLLAIKTSVGGALAVVFGGILWAMVSDLSFGQPRVVDGDTIVLGSASIRLVGIDAPELDQYCGMPNKQWQCGAAATEALKKRVGDGSVLCLAKGQDVYKRLLGRCYNLRGDLARFMVREGFALTSGPQGSRYEAMQTVAIQNLKGIWAGPFDFPREWRERKSAAQ